VDFMVPAAGWDRVRWIAPRAAVTATSYALRARDRAENESGTPTSRSANESVGPSGPNVLKSWLPDLGSNQGPAD
jgi:hypothetical protein